MFCSIVVHFVSITTPGLAVIVHHVAAAKHATLRMSEGTYKVHGLQHATYHMQFAMSQSMAASRSLSVSCSASFALLLLNPIACNGTAQLLALTTHNMWLWH